MNDTDKCINAGLQDCDCDTDKWLSDLINELMEYTYSYAKGDIAMTENPPLLLARKTQQAIKEHIAKERTQAAIAALEYVLYKRRDSDESLGDTLIEHLLALQPKPTLADIASKQPSEAATAAIRQAAEDSVKLQQEVIDYLNDPSNIAKAAEGSMDKRNEVNKPPMMCAGCNLEFPGYKEIREHMDSEHSEEADNQDNQQKGKL